MKFYITGSGGFIGSKLLNELKTLEHEVISLSRNPAEWPSFTGECAIINLAGSSIFTRFTEKAKQEIYKSRIGTTNSIIDAIRKAEQKPAVFVSASAVGYYGDGKDNLLEESALPGNDFLAKVCKDWEAAANKAKEMGVRCVNIRTGQVLGSGGILATLLPFFKLGLGGNLSSGKQYMPWISDRDIVSLYIFAALTPECQGPINASAPEHITNEQLTKILGKVLNRPTFFTIPKFALKLLYGEFGKLMLYSQKVSEQKLLSLGFKFKDPQLEKFLQNNLI